MSPLNGKTFVLELSRDIRFKAKQDLINYLREQNANISYILTASTDFVLVSNDIDTYKTRRAKQLGIPLVNVDYIKEYRQPSNGKEPVDIKRYIVTSAEDKENFSKSGTIPVSGGGNLPTGTSKLAKIDLSKIKIWNFDDVELPRFDEMAHAEIGKWAIFKETNEHSDVYFALELQIIPEEYYNSTTNDYRLRFRYEKQTIISSKGKSSLIQYAFSQDINELHQLFASYYNRIATMPRITRIRDLLPDKFGSKLLLRSLFLHRIDTQTLDVNICQLIESLWIESIGDLNKILSIRPESIALKTIIEAEATLLEIKSDSLSASEAEAHFYSLLPHQPEFIVSLITNRRALTDKIDLCQMLRDMLTVNELTSWNVKASIEAKYRALKCHIETLDNGAQEYSTISEMINSSTNSNEQVIVHQIYSIAKQTDVLNFRSTLLNQKQLFHGSKYNNFLGILSRGLLMPKMVVNDLGITRTDIGCLGYGIYFSDSVSTSLKYTTSSTTRPGRRLLCISQVALGDSAKFYSYAPTLTQAPDNFHSTHGVKKTNENNSKFVDDEFTIYNLDQQRLLYIVELSWTPFDNHNQKLPSLPIIRDSLAYQSKFSTNDIDIPTTIDDEVIQVAEQDYGLICPSSGQLVPLKAFHIRAQLVDVTAEVVLYQVYHNNSSVPIEAKYVFPLDENCSVCGFEAHINNKIIKGVVKEKEQAKREYREAIEKGHGAYLMHQEQPEVFSVSIGNLPANCEVIIQITYVAELPIENNDIIFRLPAKVASWQSKQALETNDQTSLPSIHLDQENSSMKSVEFSLKTSIRMPYEIIKLFSPTHRLRRKITDCIAMIELADNILLEKDFILSITLKSVNLPRMLNETSDRSIIEHSQACMLTFYPKFEMGDTSNELAEMIFLIDVSNSMDGKHVQQAKQLTHLFLTNMKQNDGTIYFNIVTFGSDNDECFPISSPNTKENIDKAKHFVLHSLDHRGNTDLFSVLRQYSLIPSASKLGRQFILLSDGHINDLQPTLTLLANQPSMRHDRLFTCSIGDVSNKHQLKQLANQANGGGLNTVFDSNYRSRWKTKVLQILEHIHQPCVTNISIDWHGTIDNQQEKFTNQAPKLIRSLFNGMRLTVYRFIQNCHKATLTATINNQEFVTSVFSNKMTETKGRILHCLTARSIIQDYENGLLHNDESENELIKKQYKQDLIELSVKYSVVSSFTSFVAIEERDGQALEPGVRLLDVMLEHDIDLLPYIGWDGDRSQVDLIKEKLINAKRLFDSASVASKVQLTNEYEDFCQNISYRAGGDEKYLLMLTIIDTYQTVMKEEKKARELKDKMKDDLMNEIKNATAEERTALEKRLNEISMRFGMDEEDGLDLYDSNASLEIEQAEYYIAGQKEEHAKYQWDDESCMMDMMGCELRDDTEVFKLRSKQSESIDMKQTLHSSLFSKGGGGDDDDVCIINPSLCNEESEEEYGNNLLAEIRSFGYRSAGLKLKPCDAPIKVQDKNWSSDEEGDDMGFGLFDDEIPSFAAAKVKEEKSEQRSTARDTTMALLAMRRERLTYCAIDSSSSSESWDDFPTMGSMVLTEEMKFVKPETQLRRSSPPLQQNAMLSLSEAHSSPSYSTSTTKANQISHFDNSKSVSRPPLSSPDYSFLLSEGSLASGGNPISSLYNELSCAKKPAATAPASQAPPFGNNRESPSLSLNKRLPPPPPTISNSAGFGGKSDTSSNIFGTQSHQEMHGVQQASMPATSQIDLLLDVAAPFSFTSTSSSSQPPSFTFGATNTSTTTSSQFADPMFGAAPSFTTAASISHHPMSTAAFSFGSSADVGTSDILSNPSRFSGFTNVASRKVAASMSRAPPTASVPQESSFSFGIPPPPPPPSGDLFGARNARISNVSEMQQQAANQPQMMSIPTTFQSFLPPAPPPLPGAAGLFGSTSSLSHPQSFAFVTTSATTGNLYTDPTFGAPPSFRRAALVPQRPTSSVASSFAHIGHISTDSVAATSSALAESSSHMSWGYTDSLSRVHIPAPVPQVPSFPFTTPPPPPPPPPPPGLFGARDAGMSNPWGMQQQQATSQLQMMATPLTFQSRPPPPPPLPGIAGSFGGTPCVPQQSFAFGAPSVIDNLYDRSVVDDNRPTFGMPAAPPSQSSPLSEPTLSVELERSAGSPSNIQLQMLSSHAGRTESWGRDRGSRGGGGSGSFHGKQLSKKRQEVLTADQNLAASTRADDLPSTESSQTRYCDTRSDEMMSCYRDISPLELSMDNDNASWGLESKKKKKSYAKKSSAEKTAVQDLLLLDVLPLGLGIEDINGHMCTIAERNRTIPFKTQRYSVFTNAYAYQTTATIRVFSGQHKLTKYNAFMGELVLSGLTSNFVSQVLEISIGMNIDANGLIEVQAEESQSGAKAKIVINPQDYPISADGIQRHIEFVESNSDFRAMPVADRRANDSLYMLKGETENAKINFTGPEEISGDFPTFEKFKTFNLISTTITELKRIQSIDGSFDLNQDFANLLAININDFDALKTYLYKQGFNSFALNIQNEIIRLIATGMILMQFFLQIPTGERKTYLVPFDHEQIRSIFHRHLPKNLLENVDRAIEFYEQKRQCYAIYCEQLELHHSTWEKFIQHALFNIHP